MRARSLNIVFWSVCVVTAAALSVLCARLSIAGFNAHKVELRTNAWYAVGYPEREHEWDEAFAWNTSSEQLDPYNERHKRNRFVLLDWRAYIQRFDKVSHRENLRGALAAVEDWLRVNPYSSYAWATKADLQASLGVFDAAAVQAFVNAGVIGAWEDLTRKKLMRTAVTFWDTMPDAVRQRARSLIRGAFLIDTTVQKEPIDRYIFDLAIANDWEDELRTLIEDEKLRLRFDNYMDYINRYTN